MTRIEVHAYNLFQHDTDDYPGDARLQADARVTEQLKDVMSQTREIALQVLVPLAHKDGEILRDAMRQDGTYEKTRFVRFGGTDDSSRENLRYTYLDFDPLVRQAFIDGFTQDMKDPHNVCLRTPHMKSGPRFGDIAATILSQQQDHLHYLRTGERKPVRHVATERLPSADSTKK